MARLESVTGDIAVTAITLADLLAFDESIADHYADILVTRERMGRAISTADAQIAAICRFHGTMCATRNSKDFARLRYTAAEGAWCHTRTMISFVITSRDEDGDVLLRTVDGLRATSPAAEREIVVIDDGSVRPVGSLGPGVHLVRNAEPVGVSRARRQAMAIAGGQVLVCLDAHMTFDKEWLTRMLDHVESGALLCAAFCDYERTEVGCFGADFEWVGRRDYELGRSPGFRPRHRRSDPGPGAHEVPMVLGACYMLLRSSYETLGGFSPLFRVWGVDEQDISARAWLSGLSVACVADARVGHLTRTSAPYQVVFDHVEYNQLAFLRSVFDHRTLDALLPSFDPLPALVPTWLAAADIAGWRKVVQGLRRRSDREFFQYVGRELASPGDVRLPRLL